MWHKAGDFAKAHPTLTSTAAGIAVAGLCELATASAGTIACAALGAAVAGAVNYRLTTPANQRTLGGYALNAGIGAAAGAAGGVAGRAIGARLAPLAGRAATSLASKLGRTTATTAGDATETATTTGAATTSKASTSAANTADRIPLTFRGDTRGPDEIFEKGFQPWGDDLDLLRHARGNPNSGYVATSYSRNVAEDFGPNVYTIRAPGGVDVNATLGARSPYPHEAELAFPGGVSPGCITGCILPSGKWVPNLAR